jgi:quinoprotein glucose dehydrogenase
VALDILEAAQKRPALKSKADKLFSDLGEAISLHGGNAAAGRAIFFERADVACLRCHKVGGEGGEVGPDLTGITARQPREYVLESILFPNKKIAPGYESVMVKLKSGTAVAGIVKAETADTLTLNSPEDGIVPVKKTEVVSRAPGLSSMPEGMAAILSKQDLRNLIEFLATQK